MMKVIKTDIWELHKNELDSIICIPTNGIVKVNGELVMGKGLAKQCADKYPMIPKFLGLYISTTNTNIPFYCGNRIMSFPTKYNWKDKSEYNLIRSSAKVLSKCVSTLDCDKCYLPKVGCGLGGLFWDKVEPILDRYLDSTKFIIVEK